MRPLGRLLGIDGADTYLAEAGQCSITYRAERPPAAVHYVSDASCLSPCFLGLSFGSVVILTVGDFDFAEIAKQLGFEGKVKAMALEIASKAMAMRGVLGPELSRLSIYRAYLAYKGILDARVDKYDYQKVRAFLSYAVPIIAGAFRPRACLRSRYG
jgi:hypothetical protein